MSEYIIRINAPSSPESYQALGFYQSKDAVGEVDDIQNREQVVVGNITDDTGAGGSSAKGRWSHTVGAGREVAGRKPDGWIIVEGSEERGA